MKTSLKEQNDGSILKLLLVLVMIGFVFVVSVGAVIYSSIRPSSEFRDLQDAIISELPRKPSVRVAVRAPALLVSLAQVGMIFIDDVDDEAKLAIQAVQGGQVGIYQLRGHVSQREKLRILRAADVAMNDNEWTRVTAVVEDDAMVLIYTPADIDDPRDLQVMVMVMNDEELIIASASGDLYPLYEIAKPHIANAKTEIFREFQ